MDDAHEDRSLDVRPLVEEREGPCISLFAPMVAAGRETRQNPIRFKNGLTAAAEQLGAHGLRAPDIDALLAPGRALLADERFWQQQAEGLAVFLARGFERRCILDVSLEPRAVVARRFAIRPLLAAAADDARFFVLSLSKGSVRLYACSRRSVEDVTPIDMPADIDAALRIDEVDLLPRVAPPGAGSEAGAQFGKSGSSFEDEHDTQLPRFAQQVDRVVTRVLTARHEPLVLAAVEYLFGVYRDVSSYRNLVKERYIRGNPDGLRPGVLRDEAWRILEPMRAAERTTALERYGMLQARGRGVANLPAILTAGRDGRIDELFVARDAQRWGTFDEARGVVRDADGPGPGAEDLLDLATAYAFRGDGTVRVLEPGEVPGNGDAAASLRY